MDDAAPPKPALAGPWYTLAEAQQKLDMVESELRFAIEENLLQAVCYTSARDFLLFTNAVDGWQGHCICRYRGHLVLHLTRIAQLLDGEAIILGTGSARLIEPSGIDYVREEYPFKRELPHPPLAEWVRYSLVNLPINQLSATVMPSESQDTIEMIGEFLTAFNRVMNEPPKKEENRLHEQASGIASKALNAPMHLHFNKSEFKPDCLRIPKSELDWYRRQSEGDDGISALPKPTLHIDSSSSITGSMRENQLHVLIARIVQEKPDITAKAAWRLIAADCDSDEPLYDKEHILRIVDDNCIEWVSRNGNVQYQRWRSFMATLSKIKKAAKLNRQ